MCTFGTTPFGRIARTAHSPDRREFFRLKAARSNRGGEKRPLGSRRLADRFSSIGRSRGSRRAGAIARHLTWRRGAPKRPPRICRGARSSRCGPSSAASRIREERREFSSCHAKFSSVAISVVRVVHLFRAAQRARSKHSFARVPAFADRDGRNEPCTPSSSRRCARLESRDGVSTHD